MTDRIRSRPVQYVVDEPVELEPGVILPAGTYPGTEKQIGVDLLQGIQWTNPTYHLELSAADLESCGAKNTRNLLSVEYDVTKFVRLGNIKFG